jgi:hypothetical protein
VIAFLALLQDTLAEARDKRVTWVLALIGLLLVLFCGSVSFTPIEPDAALEKATAELGVFRARGGVLGGSFTSQTSVDVVVTGPRSAEPEDDLRLGIADARVVELEFRSPDQLDQLVVAWRHFSERQLRFAEGGGLVPAEVDADITARAAAPISASDRVAFLESRLREAGFEPVFARATPEVHGRYRIAVGNERPLELRGACDVGWGFGAWSTRLEERSPAEFLADVTSLVVNQFAGFIGILVLLSVFAAAFPELLQKGRFDLLLARPIGRLRIVLYKYAGAVLVVALLWSALFAACAVALGLATGYWRFRLVGCALTCALLFAALYPAAMVVGIATRHVSLSSLAGVGTWGLERLVGIARRTIEFAEPDMRARWRPLLDGAHAVLPKATDLATLNARMLAGDHLGADAIDRLFGAAPVVDWWWAGGTTAGFAAVLVALACWLVARRDF